MAGRRVVVWLLVVGCWWLVGCQQGAQSSEGVALPTMAVTAVAPTLTPSPLPTYLPTSTPITPPPPPTPTAVGATTIAMTHIVESGETLYRIALNYDIPLDNLTAANGLTTDSLILVGDELVIPVDGERWAVGSEQTPTTTATPYPPSAITTQSFAVNGVPLAEIAVISPEAAYNIQEVYAYGQSIGRNPRAFSKLGDSTLMNPGLLVQFEDGPYNLGPYAYLATAVDQFDGSFERYGAATRVGLHSWTVMDPMWADKTWCLPNETMLACEFRLHNPSYLFIRLGTNDSGVPTSFDKHTREVVEFSIANGVIPILSTKADRFEGADGINNTILRQIASDYRLPLWEYDVVAGTIPGRGLFTDNVHIAKAGATYDYNLPQATQVGQSLHDLTALIVLHEVWQTANGK